jgi:hypothetical protein
MFETIFPAASNETAAPLAATIPALLAALGIAFVLGFLVSFVYMKTHKNKNPQESFIFTLVLLPAVVTVIIFLVGNNVARAFSLAGAFSIIRFRSAPGDPKDITYVLFSMAVGLAAGMGFILYAVIVGVALCAVMVLLELCKYGHPKGTEKILKITIPENLNFQHAFDDILQKYTLSSLLQRIKTADLGSLYELNYLVVTKDGIDEKEFIDELRCRNGNLNIVLALDIPANTNF